MYTSAIYVQRHIRKLKSHYTTTTNDFIKSQLIAIKIDHADLSQRRRALSLLHRLQIMVQGTATEESKGDTNRRYSKRDISIVQLIIQFPFSSSQPPKPRSTECPLDKDQLGKSTWSFLHTMAAYFPTQPTGEQSNRMNLFLNILPDFYPCQHCAEDLKIE